MLYLRNECAKAQIEVLDSYFDREELLVNYNVGRTANNVPDTIYPK